MGGYYTLPWIKGLIELELFKNAGAGLSSAMDMVGSGAARLWLSGGFGQSSNFISDKHPLDSQFSRIQLKVKHVSTSTHFKRTEERAIQCGNLVDELADLKSIASNSSSRPEYASQSQCELEMEYARHIVNPLECVIESQTSTSGEVYNVEFVEDSGSFSRNGEERKIVKMAWEMLVRWSRSWRSLNSRTKTTTLQQTKKVAILGGGSFGTAMAVLLARNKADMEVSILVRDSSICHSINMGHVNLKYFPQHKLPSNIVATSDAKEALKDAQFCIHAIPVQASAAYLESIGEHVPPTLPIFSVSKGLEISSLEMMSQIIPRALGNLRQPVVVISGPSFSIEIMDQLPTALVAASKDKELAIAAQELLASHYLRVNTSSDVVGVEMAGALKNVLAIAAGIVEGMQLGNNCMAALVSQGCAEIRWLAEKMGAKPATLGGLSGTGDIMLTCFVSLSRNRSLGVRLGSGEKLETILSSMNQVAEGVATAGAVIALAKKYRVKMPVLTAVARILDNELTPRKAVFELMSLPQVEEV